MAIPPPNQSTTRYLVHESTAYELTAKGFDELQEAIDYAIEQSDVDWGSVYVIIDTSYEGEDISLNAPYLAYCGALAVMKEVQDGDMETLPGL